MKTLDTLGAEDLVQNVDLARQVVANTQEANWQFRNIDKGNLEVLTQIRVLVLSLQARDHKLDNSRLIMLVELFNNLLLAVKMNGAAHDDERRV